MSNASTHDILKMRRMALAKISQMNPLAAPVLVSDPFVDLPKHGGGKVTAFKGTSVIWKRTVAGVDDKHASSLWVRMDDDGYGDKFKAFLTDTYSIEDFGCLSRSAAAGVKHQIDHVSGRVEQTDNYADKKAGHTIDTGAVRFHLIEAVPQRANSSGGGSEKKMSKNAILQDHQPTSRRLRWTHLLKLYGVMTPRNSGDEDRYREAIRVMSVDGWDPAEIRDGIDSIHRLAAHRA